MPVILLERIPLPSLQTYTSFSMILVASVVYYAHQVVVNPSDWRSTDVKNATKNETVEDRPRNVSLTNQDYVQGVLSVISEEPLCVWVMINLAYCMLINLGKQLQKAVFGNLRVSEQQHLKDKFWNFVFYKFIFVFGVLNVQHMDEVVLWSAWFTFLGCLHLLSQLCRDRFEYLSFSPTTPKITHVKVLLLLVGIFLTCSGLIAFSVLMGIWVGVNTFAFMVAECLLLLVRTLYSINRYAIHLWDLNHDGLWENKGNYMYYCELVCELTALVVDGLHHVHMLIWSNIFLSMASLVICMQLRFLFFEFQRRLKRHKNFLRVINSMEARFPMATLEELEVNDDDCAICWDKMESARKLPCNHLFHNSCLRSWLEQDTSCPTCRISLGEPQPPPNNNNHGDQTPTHTTPARQAPPPGRTTNHFFHFDASRYVSWLPSFSVEVTHTQLGARAGANVVTRTSSQRDAMVRQVQEMFPHIPVVAISADLELTRSVEATIENILEGRVQSTIELSDDDQSVSSESSQTDQLPGQRDDEPSTSVAYYHDPNIPDLTGMPESSDGEEVAPDPAPFGSRFSKSSSEREGMLDKRKQKMIEAAKQRYLAKHKQLSTGKDQLSMQDEYLENEDGRENAQIESSG